MSVTEPPMLAPTVLFTVLEVNAETSLSSTMTTDISNEAFSTGMCTIAREGGAVTLPPEASSMASASSAVSCDAASICFALSTMSGADVRSTVICPSTVPARRRGLDGTVGLARRLPREIATLTICVGTPFAAAIAAVICSVVMPSGTLEYETASVIVSSSTVHAEALVRVAVDTESCILLCSAAASRNSSRFGNCSICLNLVLGQGGGIQLRFSYARSRSWKSKLFCPQALHDLRYHSSASILMSICARSSAK
mmetsp:Transcript_36918/g.104154  ORF Transcript_36918/g.104154 Transcript_36918/m.104154 type:complete len:254 (+) Transcript_36918:214-975(+)